GRDVGKLAGRGGVTCGARPGFFVDYIGAHSLEHAAIEVLVDGMAEACRANECALLGGETAQLADLYEPGHFDLAGTVVGVVERDGLIDGSTVDVGNRVWGLSSTGLHTNGFSLARRLIAGFDLQADPGGRLRQPPADAA